MPDAVDTRAICAYTHGSAVNQNFNSCLVRASSAVYQLYY